MDYGIEDIAKAFKAARERKGLTQRALAAKTGVPQAHISNIEKGAVDLRLSSAIELARALDLELTLIPRKAVSAVRSIAKSAERERAPQSIAAIKELRRLRQVIARFEEDAEASKEIAQIEGALRELERFPLRPSQLRLVRETSEALRSAKVSSDAKDTLRMVLARLRLLRNQAAHASAEPIESDVVRPAYTLEEEEDDDA